MFDPYPETDYKDSGILQIPETFSFEWVDINVISKISATKKLLHLRNTDLKIQDVDELNKKFRRDYENVTIHNVFE